MSQFIKRATSSWSYVEGGRLSKNEVAEFQVIFRSVVTAALLMSAPLLTPSVGFAQAAKSKPTPATPMEVNTYGVMSIATFCEARAQKIDFNKSLAVALAGQLHVIYGKHGGLLPGSKKPLPEKQFLNNAGFMIVGGALKFCPKSVPPAEKARFEKAAATLKPLKPAKQ